MRNTAVETPYTAVVCSKNYKYGGSLRTILSLRKGGQSAALTDLLGAKFLLHHRALVRGSCFGFSANLSWRLKSMSVLGHLVRAGHDHGMPTIPLFRMDISKNQEVNTSPLTRHYKS